MRSAPRLLDSVGAKGRSKRARRAASTGSGISF